MPTRGLVNGTTKQDNMPSCRRPAQVLICLKYLYQTQLIFMLPLSSDNSLSTGLRGSVHSFCLPMCTCLLSLSKPWPFSNRPLNRSMPLVRLFDTVSLAKGWLYEARVSSSILGH